MTSSGNPQQSPNGAKKQRVVSGLQPTSDSYHLGNYPGAVKQFITLQDDYDAFYFIRTSTPSPCRDIAECATGTSPVPRSCSRWHHDPDRSTLFVQSTSRNTASSRGC